MGDQSPDPTQLSPSLPHNEGTRASHLDSPRGVNQVWPRSFEIGLRDVAFGSRNFRFDILKPKASSGNRAPPVAKSSSPKLAHENPNPSCHPRRPLAQSEPWAVLVHNPWKHCNSAIHFRKLEARQHISIMRSGTSLGAFCAFGR